MAGSKASPLTPRCVAMKPELSGEDKLIATGLLYVKYVWPVKGVLCPRS
jgi:hypothetical protein